jgi:hypothetical protein
MEGRLLAVQPVPKRCQIPHLQILHHTLFSCTSFHGQRHSDLTDRHCRLQQRTGYMLHQAATSAGKPYLDLVFSGGYEGEAEAIQLLHFWYAKLRVMSVLRLSTSEN